MNKKSRTANFILRNTLLVLLVIALVAAQAGLFLLLQPLYLPQSFETVALYSVIAMLLSIVVFAVVNNIRFRKLVKKYNDKQNLAANYDEMQSYYEKSQSDYLAAEKDVVAKKNKIIMHKVLLSIYVSLIAIICALGANKDSELLEFFISVAVICMFCAPMLWIDLLTLFKDASEYNMQELSASEYPEFYKVVEDAKKTLGCYQACKIYPVYGSSIAVSSSANCIHICFDCEETMLLTRDELYNIMLHEIAHVVNSDTKRSRSLAHFSYAMEHFGGFSTNLFFSSEYVDFTLKNTFYYLACTRFYEQAADDAVRKFGNGQVYINGTSKGMLLEMFRNCYKPKVDFDVYASETLPTDYYFSHLQYFKEYLPINIDRWDFLLRNRILSRQDTHPTFAMRMKFMGVDNYDYSTVETQEQFVAEQQKLLKLGCKRLAEETKWEYKNAREQWYIPTKAKIDEYHSLGESGKALSNQQKTEYIQMLFDVDREECLKLCDEVLAEAPKNSYANYFKGLILAENLDRNCVQHLYVAAAENFNFAETAINAIGEFACNVGDEELLQQYRARATDDISDMMDRQENSTMHAEDTFTANRLEIKDYNEVLDYIVEAGKDIIENVYSVSRGEGKNMLTAYIVEIANKTKLEDADKLYSKIFGYLDRYGDGEANEYNFSLNFGRAGVRYVGTIAKIMNKVKKTENSLIYSKSEGKKNR